MRAIMVAAASPRAGAAASPIRIRAYWRSQSKQSRPRRARARASRRAASSPAAPASPYCRPPPRRIWVALSVRSNAKPGARIITDGLKSYDALADSFRHYSIVQGGGENADAVLPIVHVLFSNLKTWLNGTFHGVSAKHLPRYAREWNYRFNRRLRIADLTDFLLRRAATRPTITYRQLVDGAQINGALPVLTG